MVVSFQACSDSFPVRVTRPLAFVSLMRTSQYITTAALEVTTQRGTRRADEYQPEH